MSVDRGAAQLPGTLRQNGIRDQAGVYIRLLHTMLLGLYLWL